MNFEPTKWTLVMQCSRDDETGQAALEDLCRRYWEPLYTFARCSGQSAHDAEDEVQAFLALSVDRNLFGSAQKERGKLRNFLLTAFRRHLVNSYRKETTAKRGGTQTPLSINREEVDFDLQAETLNPEVAFDRRWALRTVEVALEQLEARYSPRDYSAFRPFLLNTGIDGYAEAAEAHGISVSGFKVGVHRIRKRFREELEKVVSATIDETDDVSIEMSYLLEVLSQCNLDGRYTT